MKKSTLIISAATAALMMSISAGAHAQSWADNTTVSGRMYYDFTNLSTKTNGVESGANNGTGFDITRFYTSVDHKFTDIFSGDITTDFQYNTTLGATELYLKKAYLDANFDPAFDVKAGATDMPWIPYVENIYGNRFVEKTMVDKQKFGTSSDWGLHAAGTFGKASDGNTISYQVSMVNGNGYKNPTRSKTMDVETRLSAVLAYQWNFAVGTYSGDLGQNVFGSATPPKQKASRFDALAAWVGDQGRIGAEYFSAKNDTAALVDSSTPDKESGTSIFGTYRFNHDYSVFANTQNVKPSDIVAVGKTKTDDYYNVGATYSAFKNVDFSLVLKHDTLDVYKTVGAAPTFNKTVSNEVGIFAQFRY